MASTYDELGTEVMATGENINTWGTKLNEAKALLIEAIKGVASVPLTDAGLVLSIPQNAPGNGRKALIKVDGGALTAPGQITVPAIQKLWFFHYFGSAHPVIVTAGSETATIRPNSFALLYCDGVDVFNPELTLDQIKPPAADVAMNNRKLTGLAAGTAPADGATKGQVDAVIADATEAASGYADQAGVSATNAASAAGTAVTARNQAQGFRNEAAQFAKDAADSAAEAAQFDPSSYYLKAEVDAQLSALRGSSFAYALSYGGR